MYKAILMLCLLSSLCIAMIPVVYAFDRVVPYVTKRNFEVIQNNFQSVRYQKLSLDPGTTEVLIDTTCSETVSVVLGTVNSATGNYVTHIYPKNNQIQIGLSASSLSTTEVSVILIWK